MSKYHESPCKNCMHWIKAGEEKVCRLGQPVPITVCAFWRKWKA